MVKTEFGTFDGDKWEYICQICFKQNFREEVYIEVKATPGDYGIEGFTRTGKVFQCYCPDETYSSSDLYEKHRDKITKDLKKLKTYEKQLKTFLGDTKINKWYFVTPLHGKNDIVAHCTSKRDEVKSWQLSIVDNENFEIIFEDINFLHPHLTLALDSTNQKINLSPNNEITDGEKLKWKGSEISLVENAQKKHLSRFDSSANNVDERVDILTEKTIASFLGGNILLRMWENEYPTEYEKFLAIVSLVENEVVEKCMFPVEDKNQLYFSFRDLVTDKLNIAFPKLEQEMIMNLTNQVMADWILRCPINFE
ncbi:MAG: hypothetical protein ABIP27_10990 [Flavobacterium circumlabens]|uniref:hypothetical protein n=1 Tax=Flavobacterium circumlabens TaxID=2133765 RepID=UPI0032672C17